MKPDLVIYESTAADVGWDERRLRYLLARGIGLGLAAVPRGARTPRRRRAGLAAPSDYKRALQPVIGRSWRGSTATMAADCRARGVPIVWVLIPRVGKPNDPAEQRALVAMARDARGSRESST